jgi:hypothetical protein
MTFSRTDAPPVAVLVVRAGPLLPVLMENFAKLRRAQADMYAKLDETFLQLARDAVAGRAPTHEDTRPPPTGEKSIGDFRAQVQPGPLARATLDHLARLEEQREDALAKLDASLVAIARHMAEQVTAMHEAAAAGPAH